VLEEGLVVVSDSQCPQTGSSSEWVVKATDARGAGISTG
jgi:hypothetical protein